MGSSFSIIPDRNPFMTSVTHECHSSSYAKRPAKVSRKRKRMVSDIAPHNSSGLDDDGLVTTQVKRGKCKMGLRSSRTVVAEVSWKEMDRGKMSPISKFRDPPPQLKDHRKKIAEKFLAHYSDANYHRNRKDGAKEWLQGEGKLEEEGYFAPHVNDTFLDVLFGSEWKAMKHASPYLPSLLQIKSSAENPAIVFVNVKAGQCVTHSDADPSFLYVLRGKKTVKILARHLSKNLKSQHQADAVGDYQHRSLLQSVDPFSNENDGGAKWATVVLKAGEGLLIPQDCYHAVKSVAGTVAVSVQIRARA